MADPENLGRGNDKMDKLCIISKFRMFMMNVLDLARTCWGIVLICTIQKRYI